MCNIFNPRRNFRYICILQFWIHRLKSSSQFYTSLYFHRLSNLEYIVTCYKPQLTIQLIANMNAFAFRFIPLEVTSVGFLRTFRLTVARLSRPRPYSNWLGPTDPPPPSLIPQSQQTDMYSAAFIITRKQLGVTYTYIVCGFHISIVMKKLNELCIQCNIFF